MERPISPMQIVWLRPPALDLSPVEVRPAAAPGAAPGALTGASSAIRSPGLRLHLFAGWSRKGSTNVVLIFDSRLGEEGMPEGRKGKPNITIRLDQDTLEWVRMVAGRRGESAASILAHLIRGERERDEGYDHARRRYLYEGMPAGSRRRGRRP